MTITQSLIEDGLAILDGSHNPSLVLDLSNQLIECAHSYASMPIPPHTSLDVIHEYVPMEQLNSFRLNCISLLNKDSYASKIIVSNFMPALQSILGNDIVVQKNIGLSIQYPGDSSSLLPIHSDVLSSDCSPYEFVLWIPLVECYSTKSMFYLPFNYSKSLKEYINMISINKFQSTNEFYEQLKDSLKFVNIVPLHSNLFSFIVAWKYYKS